MPDVNAIKNSSKFRSSSPNKTRSNVRNTNRDSDNISSYETLNTLRSNQFVIGTGTASTRNTLNNHDQYTN